MILLLMALNQIINDFIFDIERLKYDNGGKLNKKQGII